MASWPFRASETVAQGLDGLLVSGLPLRAGSEAVPFLPNKNEEYTPIDATVGRLTGQGCCLLLRLGVGLFSVGDTAEGGGLSLKAAATGEAKREARAVEGVTEGRSVRKS